MKKIDSHFWRVDTAIDGTLSVTNSPVGVYNIAPMTDMVQTCFCYDWGFL
jgi:hypothetical protein